MLLSQNIYSDKYSEIITAIIFLLFIGVIVLPDLCHQVDAGTFGSSTGLSTALCTETCPIGYVRYNEIAVGVDFFGYISILV